MRKFWLIVALIVFAVGYGIGHFRGNSAGFHDSLGIVGPLQEHQFPRYGKTLYKLSYRSDNEISIECVDGADPTGRKVIGDVMVISCGEQAK